jgi:hypothetical protein
MQLSSHDGSTVHTIRSRHLRLLTSAVQPDREPSGVVTYDDQLLRLYLIYKGMLAFNRSIYEKYDILHTILLFSRVAVSLNIRDSSECTLNRKENVLLFRE